MALLIIAALISLTSYFCMPSVSVAPGPLALHVAAATSRDLSVSSQRPVAYENSSSQVSCSPMELRSEQPGPTLVGSASVAPTSVVPLRIVAMPSTPLVQGYVTSLERLTLLQRFRL